MNLCSENHEEVCYEGRVCPACEVISEYEQRIDDLQETIYNLEEKVMELEEQV